jgi:hypothetical protein
MECYCCRRDVSLVHRVKLRGRAPAYSYRWTFICSDCYRAVDTVDGVGEAGGKLYRLADGSRANRAPLYDRAKFEEYMGREALKLGSGTAPPSAPPVP